MQNVRFCNKRWKNNQRDLESTVCCPRGQKFNYASLVHTISVPRQHFANVYEVSLALTVQFHIFSTDVHLQSKEKIQREMYVKLFKEIGLNDEKMLKLLKPLYGLSKIGDYWERTFRKLLQTDMHIETCISNPKLSCETNNQRLTGLCATYVTILCLLETFTIQTFSKST